MRQKAPHLELDSAGTGNWHVGSPPYGPMQEAARSRGVELSGLRARQFRVEDFEAFDLILAMDAQNLKDIEGLRQSGQGAAVELFAPTDVPDPYYTRDFETCLDIIEAAAEALSRRLVETR